MIQEKNKEQLIAALPEGVKKQYEEKLASALKELDDKREGWSLAIEKNGLSLYAKKDKVWVTQRSETEIPLSLEVLVPYLQDTEFRKKYDNLLDGYEVLKTLQPNVQIIRSQIKGKFLISARDFVTYRIFGYLDENVSIWLIPADLLGNLLHAEGFRPSKDKGSESCRRFASHHLEEVRREGNKDAHVLEGGSSDIDDSSIVHRDRVERKRLHAAILQQAVRES